MRFKDFYITEQIKSKRFRCKDCGHTWKDESILCPKCKSKNVIQEEYAEMNNAVSTDKHFNNSNNMLNVIDCVTNGSSLRSGMNQTDAKGI
jgi:predicted ATP-dependent serine protease